MHLLSALLTSSVTRFVLKSQSMNLVVLQRNLPNKPLWKKCASRCVKSLIMTISNMKVKSCKEQLNASTNVSFMSILERSKLNCHAKIKFLVKALSHMMSLMFMFIKLKTTLKVLTSLSAVAIQNSSNVSWNKKFQKYLMEL